MNPQTSRGSCFTLPQSFTPQRQPGHPQQDPHSGCQLITNRSNFHIGSHFLCDASLHRPDLPIGWSVLVDPTLLSQDFPRTQASGQHQPKPYLRPLPGIIERHQHDSCIPPTETVLLGERVESRCQPASLLSFDQRQPMAGCASGVHRFSDYSGGRKFRYNCSRHG